MLRPGATGIRMSGTRSPRISKNTIVQAQALVLARRIPSFELDDELDALRRSRRRDAEQILHVDDAEAAQLHVMPRQLRTRADQNRLRAPPHLHRVVRDQAMAADDQVERALALADAALAGDEDAQTEHVHQHGVHDACARPAVLEHRRELGDRGRRGSAGVDERQAARARTRRRALGAARSRP